MNNLYGSLPKAIIKEANVLAALKASLSALRGAPGQLLTRPLPKNMTGSLGRIMEYIPGLKSKSVMNSLQSGALSGAKQGAGIGASLGGTFNGTREAVNQYQQGNGMDYSDIAKATAMGGVVGGGAGAAGLSAIKGGRAALGAVGTRMKHLDELKQLGIMDHGVRQGMDSVEGGKLNIKNIYAALKTAVKDKSHQLDVGLLNNNGAQGNVLGRMLPNIKGLGDYNSIDAGTVINSGIIRAMNNPRVRQSLAGAGLTDVHGTAVSNVIKNVTPIHKEVLDGYIQNAVGEKAFKQLQNGEARLPENKTKLQKLLGRVDRGIDDDADSLDTREFLRETGGFYPEAVSQYGTNTYGAGSNVRDLFHFPHRYKPVPFAFNPNVEGEIPGIRYT